MSKLLVQLLAVTLLITAALPAYSDDRYRGMTLDSSSNGADIDLLRSWNVNLAYYFILTNNARIAMNETDYLADLDLELDILENRLAQYNSRGIKVIVNLYGAPGDFVRTTAPSLHRVFAEKWAQTALEKAWIKIATRFKGNPAIYAYNLLNEPAQASVASGLLSWKDLSVKIIDTIRTIDSDVRIVIQPPYGNPDRFSSLKVIKNKGSILYSFNAYTPYDYTHQGLYGIKNGIKYPTARNNPAKLAKNLSKGFRFGKKNKVPLFISEFTVVRWANGAAAYLRDMARLFEKNRVNWTYHAFYGSKVEAGDAQGRFAYPWSVTHSTNLADRNQVTVESKALTTLKSFFKKNSF